MVNYTSQKATEKVEMEDTGTAPEKNKTFSEVTAEAKKVLQDARAEKKNIENNFGRSDKGGNLPASAPKRIKEEYRNLNETIQKCEAAIGRQKALMQESLQAFDKIFASLEEFAKNPEKSPGVPLYAPGDPLAPLGYKPMQRISTPEKEQSAQPVKKEKIPTVKAESKEQMRDRVLNDFCEKLEHGETGVTEEESRMVRSLRPNELNFIDGPAGRNYDLELSKDKKWVRVIGHAAAENESAAGKETFAVTLPLETGLKGKPEFRLKSHEEITVENTEANKREFKNQILWLQTDQAPLGSMVIISSKEISRKNYDSGKEDKGYQSYGVRKGPSGLRFVTLEYFVDDAGHPPGPPKEVNSRPYNANNALAVVGDKATVAYEGTEKDRKLELKKGLNDLGYKLISQLPFGGESSPTFQDTLRDMKSMVDQYNVSKWTYKDPIMGYTQKLEKGVLTLYKANPNYVNDRETPDEPKLAVQTGPIDLAKYA